MSDEILCIVEIPKGSRNKYEWDADRQLMLLDRYLSSSVVFPTDYGFVAESLDHEGEDPLDVLIAVSEPTFPGCGVIAKPVAVLFLREGGAREPKVVSVPCDDPNWEHVAGLDDLGEQLREEIEHFFVAYKRREGKQVTADGWRDAGEALAVVSEARRRYAERRAG